MTMQPGPDQDARADVPVPSSDGIGDDNGFRWTAMNWFGMLLGGWIALVLLGVFLHWMLGPFRAVDLGLILLAAVWGLVLVFSGIEDRLSRR